MNPELKSQLSQLQHTIVRCQEAGTDIRAIELAALEMELVNCYATLKRLQVNGDVATSHAPAPQAKQEAAPMVAPAKEQEEPAEAAIPSFTRKLAAADYVEKRNRLITEMAPAPKQEGKPEEQQKGKKEEPAHNGTAKEEASKSEEVVDAPDYVAANEEPEERNNEPKESDTEPSTGLQEEIVTESELAEQDAGIGWPDTTEGAIDQPIDAPAARTSLNDRLKAPKVSLNETIGKKDDASLAGKLKFMPVKDLRKAISIHQRALYVTHLFGGNDKAYKEAINFLESSKNYSEAKFYCNTHLGPKLGWKEDNYLVREFMEMIYRRFL